MNAYIVLVLCSVVGSTVGYYAQREAPYNTRPYDPYSAVVNSEFQQQPSQRLFWSNGQGSNQVGGTGWWATLTNKFPFLGNMFGRMELPAEYGPPNQYQVQTQYGVPNQYAVSMQYGAPARFQPQYYQAQNYQAQNYQPQPFYQQLPQQIGQRFVPAGRDVGFTDDAVIVTPPQVPIAPQPVPAPVPVAPVPVPAPVPEPEPGYQYNKPQYRLELPHK